MKLAREVRTEDIEFLKQVLKEDLPWAAEPQWAGCWVIEDDGRIISLVGLQAKVVVEPLWAESAIDAKEMAAWVDGYLARSGVRQYEFFVPDINEPFQKLIERHYGVPGVRELEGLIFFVKRQ